MLPLLNCHHDVASQKEGSVDKRTGRSVAPSRQASAPDGARERNESE